MPDKLKEMQALFLTEAAKYQVFPLDNSGFVRVLDAEAERVAGKTEFTYTGENAGIPFGNAPAFWIRTTPSPPRSRFPKAVRKE